MIADTLEDGRVGRLVERLVWQRVWRRMVDRVGVYVDSPAEESSRSHVLDVLRSSLWNRLTVHLPPKSTIQGRLSSRYSIWDNMRARYTINISTKIGERWINVDINVVEHRNASKKLRKHVKRVVSSGLDCKLWPAVRGRAMNHVRIVVARCTRNWVLEH